MMDENYKKYISNIRVKVDLSDWILFPRIEGHQNYNNNLLAFLCLKFELIWELKEKKIKKSK